MMHRIIVPTLALIAALGQAAAADDAKAAAATAKDHAAAQVEWLVSKGGYFSDKIEFRPLDPTDPKSPNGMFATADISKDETVLTIPTACLITSLGNTHEVCDTARNLYEQFKLGTKSAYAPYVNYLLDSNRHQLPTSWSTKGKKLLRMVHGKEFVPGGMTSAHSFAKVCGTGAGREDGSVDPLQEDAYRFLVSRSWNDVMVPVLDMVNHRNGIWFNVDATSAHENKDVDAYARRDIVEGEQLYLSYNECADVDCRGIAHKYVTPNIVKDYGFVEQYPRRFRFQTEGDCKLVFELDYVNAASDDGGEELEVTWHSGRPSTFQVKYLRGHLERLRNLEETVMKGTEGLDSKHERDVIVEYHSALVTALDHAIWSAADDNTAAIKDEDGVTSCDAQTNGDGSGGDDDETCTAATSPSSGGLYDGLEVRSCDGLLRDKRSECKLDCEKFTGAEEENCYDCCRDYHYDKHERVCDEYRANHWYFDKKFRSIDKRRSHYQKLEVFHNPENNDRCLKLGGWLHACTSFRSHYHEVIVHHPARYLDEVKRVAFLGGGDNMLIEEIVKYPSLELVVGLELDQQVCRTAFKHFATEPHWDNEKVQWWYGDAAKSLRMFPKEYYGSFDLVIVDLTSKVLDFLKVTDELGIMDAAALLLKPDGIVASNEDFIVSKKGRTDVTDHTVFMNYHDLPILCHQSVAMGSNAVDFIARTPKDHNVYTRFLDPVDEMEDPFDLWYNYQTNTTRANKRCKEPDADEKKDEAAAGEAESRPGILMILEAEDATMPLESLASVKEGIGEALEKAGLTKISATESNRKENEEAGGTIVFVLREGYVVARTWPKRKYCAFDIMLWSSFEKQEATEIELLAAVGSEFVGKSSSSYRIVASGVFGIGTWNKEKNELGPPLPGMCEHPDDPGRNDPPEQSAIGAVLSESTSLIQNADGAIAIICGEETRSCNSLEVLTKEGVGSKVTPVWTCPTSAADTGDSSQNMHACERDALHSLKGMVKEGGKISGIIIDPEAKRASGQILHKILGNARNRREMLADHYVVITLGSSEPSNIWRGVLLGEFQMHFSKFDPAYRAQVFFNSTSSSLEMGIFSSGDAGFYSHLADMNRRIEKQTGLVSEVRSVKNGLVNYVADFKPSEIRPSDRDEIPALERWLSQHPLGVQGFFQFQKADEAQAMTSDAQLSTALVKGAFKSTLESMQFNSWASVDTQISTIGDGCVIVALCSEGSAILVWDGRTNIDVNLFSYKENDALYDGFRGRFLKKFPFLSVAALDEQPRGIGQVVCWNEDIEDSLNDADDEDDQKMMIDICETMGDRAGAACAALKENS